MAPKPLIPAQGPESGQAHSPRSGHAPARGRADLIGNARERPDGFPLVAAVASVLVHAVVIAMLASTPLRPPVRSPENNVITMRLIPRPVIDERTPAADVQPPEATVEPDTETPPEREPVPEPVAASSSDEPSTSDASTISESAEEPAQARTGTLRATILEQVRALPAESEGERGPALPWISSGEPIPGVPGVRGWISAYVGTVESSSDTWKDNDGSSRGRYVLANGTVVCTRRRAPTIDELMNPWKSTAVTMGSICGRQRPDSPDFSDPRVQPPPSSVGGPPADGE